jgi:hypothetical protein
MNCLRKNYSGLFLLINDKTRKFSYREEINTTRLTGGLLCGYKPLLPASA